ncbi:nitrous oxide reductase accessory protein NosL [Tropicibacter oceani]|uniref:Nitrous oxide reductase accessory protein NosL n=1 Tax=Tropicibacter oceani TaxID=3058420 RepID=A0ABY8QDF1_9RHOB|nr:nitrous oxide reductase accessory protein NosL [Tropicibacter oceani]WGW02595.1 nitrous oxide reductase accessory protein NosL [Tropicibacter oceani]
MKALSFLLIVLALGACKKDVAQDTAPVPLTAGAVGHYCQMDLLEHAGPKAQAHLGGLPGAPLFFSQVRDVVAYMRMPEQSHEIVAVWVNDMGAPHATWQEPGQANWIAAQDAVYVVGARVLGGMGAPELVPFADPSAAARFATANGGQVMRLDQIPDSAVLAPVELTAETDDTTFQDRLRVLSRELGE